MKKDPFNLNYETILYEGHNLYAPDQIYDTVSNGINPHLVKWFFSQDLNKFFLNRTVVDAGSGLGRFIPLISFFKPKKIISLEPIEHLIEKQKIFCTRKFLFLSNKPILSNIEYYNLKIEDFLNSEKNFDTLCLIQVLPHIDINKVLENSKVKNLFIISYIEHASQTNLLVKLLKNKFTYNFYDISNEKIWDVDKKHFMITALR